MRVKCTQHCVAAAPIERVLRLYKNSDSMLVVLWATCHLGAVGILQEKIPAYGTLRQEGLCSGSGHVSAVKIRGQASVSINESTALTNVARPAARAANQDYKVPRGTK